MKRSTVLLPTLLILMAHPGQSAMVMDQIGDADLYNTAASITFTSQIFSDFPNSDSMALDDFTVTGSQLRVTGVSALFEARAGIGSFNSIPEYRINLYTNPMDAGLSPLDTSAALSLLVPSGPAVSMNPIGATNFGVLALEVDIVLPGAGTYWIGVAPVTAKAVHGELYIQNNGMSGGPTPGGINGYFANPGEELGFGKISAQPVDFAYAVTVVPEPLAPGLFAISGLFLLRRQRERPRASRTF